ncbi:ubiE/COQ5 methyltransferase family protein [Burkholderia thailandensis Phuket 4W-1]|uniref:Methlytransferase, UbiE/COQ5 family n=2 Tax=Burkholderia thailandensis TaxID=57975 RepID=Q2T8J7_BURTA|nr:methlytransferase, UbiE/COQ5 family [Burkholderia thailandensis E264]AIS98363.1 methyltransferase domain protein [Burkholderia thailandensis MSMB59]AIT22976.1 methyltransferase domain protein [Burkholderia thailandensis E254]AJY02349.1 ubiE/COQ5 methyltransferase family protein [Burkholderia thailandensis 2002721643]KIS55116.1 ubiE/COQ5 methyltransferase family protein [Burkholderia thailandensis Phuket 4W-1]
MSSTHASARFDAIADNYARSEVHESSPSLTMLRALSDGRTDLDVCDVACAAGHSAFAFLGRAKLMCGVDPSPNMLRNFVALGRARGAPVRAVEAYAESMPLPDQGFDFVVCRLAAHHFHDIARALAEFRRILRPGGSVVIIDLQGDDDPECDGVNHQLEVLHDPTHVRSYTVARWRELLENAGLRIATLERDLTERPGGVGLARWCDIANSGDAAYAAMVALLDATPRATLDAIGVRRDDRGYTVPVRTCFIEAQAR